MDATDLLEVLRPGPPAAEPLHLITCSLCLRVLRGSEWIEAERVITELRTYDLDVAPRLEASVCDDCSELIESRRIQREQVAA